MLTQSTAPSRAAVLSPSPRFHPRHPPHVPVSWWATSEQSHPFPNPPRTHTWQPLTNVQHIPKKKKKERKTGRKKLLGYLQRKFVATFEEWQVCDVLFCTMSSSKHLSQIWSLWQQCLYHRPPWQTQTGLSQLKWAWLERLGCLSTKCLRLNMRVLSVTFIL